MRVAWAGVIVAIATVVAACGPDLVEIERADRTTVPAPVPEPGPTSPPFVEPPDTRPQPPLDDTPLDEPSPEESTPGTEPETDSGTEPERRDPELGVGDAVFAELGSSDVDVISYHVALDIDPRQDTVAATVETVVDVADDVGALPFDQLGLDVRSVLVDGADAGFETTDTELLIELPAHDGSERDDDLVVEIDYSFRPEQAISDLSLPSGWFANSESGESYVLNQPDGARTWLPSNDHPSDKAAWTFDIDVPEGFVAVANGELVSRPSGGVDRPWSWSEDEPMSTYLVQLIVGDYEIVVPEPLTNADGSDIELLHLVPAGERDVFDDALGSVAEQVAFFEDLFGPYPLARYGLAFVSDLRGIAMETQGRSMFGADDFSNGRLGFVQELLLAHELAHQWFGNAVSPATWSDIWLSESITTYAQWLWLDEVGLQPLEQHAALVLDRRQAPLGSTGEPTQADMFGFVRYDGGAAVVHALRSTIGDATFFEVLERWITDNAGTSRSTDDFLRLVEDVHGEPVDEWADAWLFADVLPPEYP